MQNRWAIKGNSGDIVPARQLLSDSRIKSSHGNNIFIFQGHRISFISIQLQEKQAVFFLCKVSFVSCGMSKGQREKERETKKIRKTKQHKQEEL